MELASLVLAAELIGTVAFALSGSVLAVKRDFDIFGTLVLGIVTAVGGGMLRDITLGAIPPALFKNPVYVIVAACSSLALFVACRFFPPLLEHLEGKTLATLLNIMDAIGLGFFTVIGVNTALAMGHTGLFLCVVVGMLTGVGGGIIRDLLATRTPVVLKKHVYAVASIAGAVCCYYTLAVLPASAAFLISAGLVVVIRLLASHYRWNLPRARRADSTGDPSKQDPSDE